MGRVEESGLSTAIQACPTARWSEWLMYRRSSSQNLVGSGVTRTSGRYRRTSRVRDLRRSSVTSTIPSGMPMNTQSVTPRTSHAARCSTSRISASSSRIPPGSFDPAEPSVTHTYTTSVPARVQEATVPADPNSASSGWAKTTMARSNSISRPDYPNLVQPPSEQGKRLGRPPSGGDAPSPTEDVRYLNSMAFYESPRLGTRFALTSLIAFIVIGVVLAFGISGQLHKREEQAATDHALFVAKSILPYEVTTEDVISPMDPTSDRFEHLNDVVRN